MNKKDRERLTELAASFPVLKDAPGTAPFDAEALIAWRESNDCIGAAYFAVTFVLGVAGHGHDFDAVAALSAWPIECRLAFLAWAAAPWTVGTREFRGDTNEPAIAGGESDDEG